MPSRRKRADPASPFTAVPDDILAIVVRHLDAVPDLLRLHQVCKRFQLAVANEQLWQEMFTKRFGAPSKLQREAHKLSQSWLALYRSKSITLKASEPWRKPCEFELQAAINNLTATPPNNNLKNITMTTTSSTSSSEGCSTPKVIGRTSSTTSSSSTSSVVKNNAAAAAASEDPEGLAVDPAAAAAGVDTPGGETASLCVVFLVDGSGSVGEEDFSCMTNFLLTAAEAVAAVPDSKVCVVQFSSDSRVEVPLAAVDRSTFEAGIQNMVRMNGGTNIAAAVAKAGSLLNGESAASRRVLVLLTDGRIDSYQAREAGHMVGQLSDEQSNVSLWAFGVGRGVDSAELMRIIEGPGETAAGLGRERYVELCVRDDAPW